MNQHWRPGALNPAIQQQVRRLLLAEREAKPFIPPKPETPESVLRQSEQSIERADAEEPTVHDLVHLVARLTTVPVSEIKGPRRQKHVTAARRIICWLARRLTSKSMPQIARALDLADHTTVLHACRKLDETIVRECLPIHDTFDAATLTHRILASSWAMRQFEKV